ncbi:MAG: GAF domain-containing protein [Chloroflexi bacterium]|nr:GAF domain-containing protein [Chloroflexota bacterium]
MALPTPPVQDAADKEQAINRLRQASPHLRSLVEQVLRRNIGEMTGTFTSVRRLPAQAEEIAAHFLDAVQGRLGTAEFRAQLRVWAQRGLEPMGAFEVMETLYHAGIDLGEPALVPLLEAYRRQFTIAYDLARREEILAEHERLQRGLFSALEKQIQSEREARAALQRRQAQLQITAELARTTTATRDLRQLMNNAAHLLQEGLGLDFVGIFLLDEARQWASLRAGAGEVGAAVTERGYQLGLDASSFLTRVRAANQPLILVEGKYQNEFFLQQILPETRLIAAAPLVTHGETLGFWTAHSENLDVLTEQDAAILTLIADDLAYAIENAELFTRATTSLEELERTQRGYIRQAWTNRELSFDLTYSQKQDTFERDDVGTVAAETFPTNGDAHNALSVPITLRGQVIGTVDVFDVTQERNWTDNEKAMASSVVEQMAMAVENARLFEESQRRAQELESLNQITNIISKELDLERLWTAVHEQVRQVMPADAFFVTLYDPATDSVTYPYIFDDDQHYSSLARPLAPRGNLRVVIESGQSVLVNRSAEQVAAAQAALTADTAVGNASKASASLLYAPMQFGNEVIGCISAQSYTLNAYSERSVKVMAGIAIHVAIALRNAQLFRDTQDAANRLATLNRIARAATAPVGFDELAQVLYQEINALLKPDAFLIALYSPTEQTLDFRLQVDRGIVYPPERRQVSNTLTGQVITSGKAVLIGDLPNSENPDAGVIFGSTEDIRTWFGIPLRSGNDIIGVLSIQSYTPDAFGETEANLLETIGDQVGVAIERARLFDETETRARETAIINEMARELSGQIASEKLYATVYAYLPRLMPTDAFIVWLYDSAQGAVTRPVLYDQDQLLPDESGPRPPEGLAARVIETGEPVLLNRTVEAWNELHAARAQEADAADPSASLLYVPLRVGAQLRGVLSVQTYKFSAYGPRQLSLLTSVANHVVSALDNAQLFSQTQSALAETQTLYDINSQLNAATTLDELLPACAAPALSADARSVLLLLAERDANDVAVGFRLAASAVPTGPRLPIGTPFPLSNFAIGRYFFENPSATVFAENVEQDSQIDETTRALLLRFGDHAMIMLPLTRENRLLGTLMYNWKVARPFPPSERRFYAAIASQLALALNNRLLFQETQNALAESQLLYDIGGRLNQVTTLDDLVRIAAQPAFELGAGSAQLFLLEYQDQPVPVAANVVVSLIASGEVAPVRGGTHFPFEQFTFGTFLVGNRLQPILIENVETNPLLDELTRQTMLQADDHAVVVLPMSIEQRVLGAILIGWSEARTFTPRERRIYQSLASQLAIVLNNRLLFDQTQAALAETQTLYEISARLNTATSIQEALEAAAGPAIVEGAASAALLRMRLNADGEPDELEFVALWPRSGENPIPFGTRFPVAQSAGAERWLADPHEPVLLGDIANDASIDDAGRSLNSVSGINASALLPIKLGARWIGMLIFNWVNAHSFSPRDARLYRATMAQAAIVFANRDLFEQTQAALEQTQSALAQVEQAQQRLNVQYQTARILASESLFETALPQLLELTCHTLNWQVGEFWQVDEVSDKLRVQHVWHTETPELDVFTRQTHALAFGQGQGLVGRTWTAGKPIWVPDIFKDPGFEQTGLARAAGLVSAFAFPLMIDKRVYGVTVFFSNHPQTMDEPLIATMVGLGNQVGQFLERRRAEEAVRQQNTYLTALHDTALGLMRRLDLQELLQNIIARAAELVGTQHGYVHLVEPSGKDLQMRVGVGVYQDFVGTRVRAWQGLAGTVWQQGEPIVVDDYRLWPGRLPMVDRDVLRAVVGVPLKSGDQTVGVIGLASLEEGRTFGAVQVETIKRFAELAAVALDNAQLYESTQQVLAQTQRVAQREKTSAEIAERLYAAPDVQAVLRTAAEELRRSTGSRRTVVRLNLGKNGEAKSDGDDQGPEKKNG